MDRVDFYVVGTAETRVHFPNGNVCCRWCPYCKYREANGRRRTICIKTYELLRDMDKRGEDCPLVFTGEIIEKKGETDETAYHEGRG